MQEKAAAKAKAVDAYNEAHRAKPLMEQHADKAKKVPCSASFVYSADACVVIRSFGCPLPPMLQMHACFLISCECVDAAEER